MKVGVPNFGNLPMNLCDNYINHCLGSNPEFNPGIKNKNTTNGHVINLNVIKLNAQHFKCFCVCSDLRE